jgi:hypothetical protein
MTTKKIEIQSTEQWFWHELSGPVDVTRMEVTFADGRRLVVGFRNDSPEQDEGEAA